MEDLKQRYWMTFSNERPMAVLFSINYLFSWNKTKYSKKYTVFLTHTKITFKIYKANMPYWPYWKIDQFRQYRNEALSFALYQMSLGGCSIIIANYRNFSVLQWITFVLDALLRKWSRSPLRLYSTRISWGIYILSSILTS